MRSIIMRVNGVTYLVNVPDEEWENRYYYARGLLKVSNETITPWRETVTKGYMIVSKT